LSKIVIAGGSGFIGHALIKELGAAGYEVTVLSRDGKSVKGADVVKWDGEHVGPWAEELEGAKAVINLAGESVVQHWSEASKQRILLSRVLSTRAIGQAITAAANPPEVWINASAVGYYGDRKAEELTEASAPGPRGSFLVDVCVAWENEIATAATPRTRKAWLRIGFVLGRGGGAFEPLYSLTKWFLGGHVGNGSQSLSWIHVQDLARLFRWVVESPVEGAINGTSPESVTNRYLMASLRAVVGRPWAPPVPAFMLKVVAGLGGPPASLMLESQRALPAKALESGFKFEYTNLTATFSDLVR
jgi:uncharacterized protein